MTTGHLTAANGREDLSSGGSTHSAVTTSRLVAMCTTNASGQFTAALCVNWLNRKALAVSATGSGLQTSSTSNAALGSPMQFVTWGNQIADISMSGSVTNSLASGTSYTFLDVDGTGQV